MIWLTSDGKVIVTSAGLVCDSPSCPCTAAARVKITAVFNAACDAQIPGVDLNYDAAGANAYVESKTWTDNGSSAGTQSWTGQTAFFYRFNDITGGFLIGTITWTLNLQYSTVSPSSLTVDLNGTGDGAIHVTTNKTNASGEMSNWNPSGSVSLSIEVLS